METCALCRVDLGPVIADSTYWRLILNRNQDLLGKCFLVLRRHLEAVPMLSADEWSDLHRQIQSASEMLTRAFRPDHFNYAFLQNQDRHVHLHIIPRYAGSRTFEGMEFADRAYPGHYDVTTARQLSHVQSEILARHLQICFGRGVKNNE